MPNKDAVHPEALGMRFNALLVGFACFFMCYCGGGFEVSRHATAVASWEQGLICQFINLAAMALTGCFLRSLVRKGPGGCPLAPGIACLGAMAACIVGAYALDDSPASLPAVYLLSLVVGVAAAYPHLIWFNGMLAIYRFNGKTLCLKVFAVALVVSAAVPSACTLFGLGRTSVLAFSLATLAVSAVCLACLLGSSSVFETNSRRTQAKQVRTYRLAPHTAAVLVCLGVTWGLIVALTAYEQSVAVQLGLASLLPTLGTVCCALALAIQAHRFVGQNMKFGLLIRITVGASGLVLSLSPILESSKPQILCLLCSITLVLHSISTTLFSVEICHEERLDVFEVMPVNYALFAGTACCSAGLFLVFQTFALGHLAWDLIVLLAMTAIVAVLPALPSGNSTASVFARKKLPESEDFKSRATEARAQLARTYGLTPRESEVLDLLLQGKTRQEIAELLALSTWTVKEHIANVYEKTGVHSSKKLMALVGDQGASS